MLNTTLLRKRKLIPVVPVVSHIHSKQNVWKMFRVATEYVHGIYDSYYFNFTIINLQCCSLTQFTIDPFVCSS